MYCGNCGKQNLNDSAYCEGCGRPLDFVPEPSHEMAQTNKCQSCQMEIPESMEPCPYCGNNSSVNGKPRVQQQGHTSVKNRKAIFIIIPILLVLIVAVAVAIKFAFFNDSNEEALVVEAEEHVATEPATITDAMQQAEEVSLEEDEPYEQEIAVVTSPEPDVGEGYDDIEDYNFSYEPDLDNAISLYLVDGFILPQSERTALTSDDIYDAIFAFEDSDGTIDGYFEEPISTYAWLGLARNEIFARHGHHFQTGEYARYFSQFDWYRGLDKKTVTYEDLSEVEQKNVSLIKDVSETFLGEFDINGYIFSFSGDREITDEELEKAIDNADWEGFEDMLLYAFAEIFARHGEDFYSSALNGESDWDFYNHYIQFEWYQQLEKKYVVVDDLNEFEIANVIKLSTLLGLE